MTLLSTKTVSLLIIISAIVTLHSTNAESSVRKINSRSSYGESCNKTLKCKSQAWLACDPETETCLCAKPDDMIYEPLREKCVALIGESCKFGFDEDERSQWYEKAECVVGAVCGPSGHCSCPTGYYEDLDFNQCSPVKAYGQLCYNKFECNQDKFLSCTNGTCQCDPDNAIYNPATFYDGNYGYNVPGEVCVGRVGTTCSRYQNKFCVRNSYCNENGGGTCKCSSSFSPTSDLLCGRGYDQECSESSGSVCSDRLVCAGKGTPGSNRNNMMRCQCPHPDYQQYDTTTNTCKGFIGSPCNPNDKNSCTEKSICVERDNMFQCECDDGFVLTKNRLCQREYGYSCNYDSANIRSLKISDNCDELAELQCIGRICSCRNAIDIYEANRRQCLRPVGVECQLTNQCVTHSICFKSGNEELPGRCICQDGYHVQRNHTCIKENGQVEDTLTTFVIPTSTTESNWDSLLI